MPRILIVDDDMKMRTFLLAGLSSEFSPVGAASVAEAVEEFQRMPPQVAILDLHLSDEYDGLKLLEALRSVSEGQGMRIAMLTGDSDAQPEAVAFKVGVDAYFRKPVALDKLKDWIRRSLAAAGPQASD